MSTGGGVWSAQTRVDHYYEKPDGGPEVIHGPYSTEWKDGVMSLAKIKE